MRYTFQWHTFADKSASVKVFLDGKMIALHVGKLDYLTSFCKRRYRIFQ